MRDAGGDALVDGEESEVVAEFEDLGPAVEDRGDDLRVAGQAAYVSGSQSRAVGKGPDTAPRMIYREKFTPADATGD